MHVNIRLAHVRIRTFRCARTVQLLLKTVLALIEMCVLLRFCAAEEVRGLYKAHVSVFPNYEGYEAWQLNDETAHAVSNLDF
jgi:hypothetical protein